MKKHILLVVSMLACVANTQAGIKELSSAEISLPKLNNSSVANEKYIPKVVTKTICADGLKFLLVTGHGQKSDYSEGQYVRGKPYLTMGGTASGITVTQMYEERNGKSLPATCK